MFPQKYTLPNGVLSDITVWSPVAHEAALSAADAILKIFASELAKAGLELGENGSIYPRPEGKGH